MRRVWLSITLLCAALTAVRAEEPAAWSIMVELRVIAVPVAQAPRLIPALRRAATFAEAEARLGALIADGEAEVLQQIQSESINGTKVVAESIEEARYRTDVGPICTLLSQSRRTPYAWEILSGQSSPLQLLQQERVRRRDQLSDERLRALASSGFPINLTTPTSFETRNTGLTLEAEPQLDAAQKTIELPIAVRWVRLDGLETTLAGRAGAPQFNPPQPRFSTGTFQTSLTLTSGQGALLGTLLQPQPRPRMFFFLVRATARPTLLSP